MSLDFLPLSPPPAVELERVEWRVDSDPFTRDGRTACRYVPYIDAARVGSMLDEWVGNLGWSDSYEMGTIAGKEVVWCHLTIDGVTKSDVGVASNMEAQKGAVSDAFKRAAILKWGVGRNVYELPTLWGPCDTYTSKGKERAKSNRQTKQALLQQLEERGINDIRVEDSASSVVPTASEAENGAGDAGTTQLAVDPASPVTLPALTAEETDLATGPCQLCMSTHAKRVRVGGKTVCRDTKGCKERQEMNAVDESPFV